MRTVDLATASGIAAGSAAPAISVVIPAYNEENAVIPTIERVRQVLGEANIPFELVVVNDGSKDGTAAAAKSTGVHVVDFPHNGGYGRALKAGIAVTKAPLVAIIDADGTYPPEMLPQMIEMAAYNEMVVGDRGAAMKACR